MPQSRSGACAQAPLLFFQYTMTPRSGLNKTAPAAVLHGSMFSKPCASAQGRVPCARAAAQAAGLRLLYHDAAKRPQQNRTCCGFAWFNVLKPMRESASAHEVRAAAQAAGLRLLYHENRGKRSSAFSRKIKRAAQNVPPAAVQEKPHALSTVFPPAAPFPAKGRRQAAARAG